jgi:hypothetical protein
MKFLEFVSGQERLLDVKKIILNFLGASEGALDNPVANFRKFRDLDDEEKNPELVKIIKDSDNNAAIIAAIENAASTKISIADLIALFATGETED